MIFYILKKKYIFIGVFIIKFYVVNFFMIGIELWYIIYIKIDLKKCFYE